ncbi:T9SS type A sorting domain-containing protein [Desulfosarcina sp.]|nr:T9SS type A sorting domain-containing protein [Desulfosarcina sp.]
MKKASLIITILILLGSQISKAQNPECIVIDYYNGLYDIAVSDEYVYTVSSMKRIIQWDKQTGEPFIHDESNAPLSMTIPDIQIGPENNLWVASSVNGLLKYNGTEWQIFDTLNSGLPCHLVSSICWDENNEMWIGTWGCGLVHYDGANWTIYNSENIGIPVDYVKNLIFDSDGNLWFSCSNNEGAIKFDGENIEVFNTTNSPMPHDLVLDIDIDPDGVIWFATYGGIAKFDGINWEEVDLSVPGIYPDKLTSLTCDSQGKIWIGTKSYGLVTFDGNDWEIFNPDNSIIPRNWVHEIAIDQNNDKWIATWGGLVKFDDINWDLFRHGWLGGSVNSFGLGFDNDIWITSGSGISIYDFENWNYITSDNSPLLTDDVREIATDPDGAKWLATDSGIYKIDGTNWIYYNDPSLPSCDIRKIESDNQGNIWATTQSEGVVKFNGVGWEVFNTSNSDLPDNYIGDITIQEDGTVWMGFFSGIVKYDGEFTIYDESNAGFPLQTIMSIEADKLGNIWASNWGNLIKFNGSDWSYYSCYDSTLPACITMQLHVTEDNLVYMGSLDMGLSIFDGENFTNLNPENSPIPDHYIENPWVDNFGNVWFSEYWGTPGVYKEDGIITNVNNQVTLQDTENLVQVYPNPFKNQITLKFENPIKNNIHIKVFNNSGQEISMPKSHFKLKSEYEICLNTDQLKSGIYFIQVNSDSGPNTKKVFKVR